MTDSRVASLAALLQRGWKESGYQPNYSYIDLRTLADWLERHGVTVCTRCGEGLMCIQHGPPSRLGEPSPEGPWEAAYIEHRGAWSIRRRADVDREHEVFAMTADRRKAVAVAGALNRLGVRVGSEETPQ